MKKRFIVCLLAIIYLLSHLVSGCSGNPQATPPQETPHAHNYSQRVVNPTCTEDGYTVFTCDCGHTYNGDTVNALGHLFENYVFNNDATESIDGTETSGCSRIGCSETHTRTAVGTMLNHSHSYTDKVTQPTCEQNGYTTHACACGHSYTDTPTNALGHNFVNKICARCSEPEPFVYEIVNSSGTPTQYGNYVKFGNYPKTDVTSSLGDTLSGLAGTLPTADNAQTWTAYKYYLGTGEQGTQYIDEYMWYKDVKYNGNTYRGVYFTSYRPTSTCGTGENSGQETNGYLLETVYWFKFEPLIWEILTCSDNVYTLLCKDVIDVQAYQNNVKFDYDGDADDDDCFALDNVGNILIDQNGNRVNASNYAFSTIRKWLNADFYNLAFSDAQKALIQTSAVSNNAYTTGDESNPYYCETTQDRVYLLSYREATDVSYFLNKDSRCRKNTDYAKVQGAYVYTVGNKQGNNFWLLRSPYSNNNACVQSVTADGSFHTSMVVYSTNYGIVPVLQMQIS